MSSLVGLQLHLALTIYTLPQLSSLFSYISLFSYSYAIVLPVLAVANTGSCAGPQSEIGHHPAGCRFPVLSARGM